MMIILMGKNNAELQNNSICIYSYYVNYKFCVLVHCKKIIHTTYTGFVCT